MLNVTVTALPWSTWERNRRRTAALVAGIEHRLKQEGSTSWHVPEWHQRRLKRNWGAKMLMVARRCHAVLKHLPCLSSMLWQECTAPKHMPDTPKLSGPGGLKRFGA